MQDRRPVASQRTSRDGRPTLRYKDTCKRDLKACGIQTADLKTETSDRTAWWAKVKDGVK